MNYKTNTINICFVTDDNYAPYVGVAIYSIIKNAKKDDHFHFYIFDDKISTSTKNKLSKMIKSNSSITFVDVSSVENIIKDLKQTVSHITKSSYLKFAIADLLPQVDKIIYLDGDLVVQNSLSDLYNIDLEDNLIAAVEDVGYTYWSKHREELKLKFLCMNSGVMLINCNLWRKEKLSDKLIEITKNHDIVGFGQDQPVLNYVLKGRVKFIPYKWNVQDTFFRKGVEYNASSNKNAWDEATLNPVVIHYTFVKKPWVYPFMNKAEIFWEYYLNSPFITTNLALQYTFFKKIHSMKCFNNSNFPLLNKFLDFKYDKGNGKITIILLGIKISKRFN